jgi:phage gp29-like protein
MPSILYDALGRPLRTSETFRPDTRELASIRVRDRWSGYPSNGLTPERLARIFLEADGGDMLRQAELFEEMEEKDAHLSSQFQIRKLAVQGLDWELIPGGENPASRETAVFCRDFLEAFPDLDGVVLDLLDALAKGYSVLEILWEASEKQASIRALPWVHPKKATFRDSNTLRVLTEDEPVRGIELPPFKFVYHRYKARSGHDNRGGILRVCAWMYLFKNYSIKDWVSFAEVCGMPLRVGKYEPGASKADKEALIQAIRSLGTDAAGIISKSTEIQFIEAQKSSSLNIYESLARFCDAQTSKAILGQTLTSEAGGPGGSGSYALGRVHGDVRQDLTEADCIALAKTITRQILTPLVGFNFGWDAPVPLFRFLFEPPENLKLTAETYRILIDCGFDMSQEHVSERFKVPMRKQHEQPLSRRKADDRGSIPASTLMEASLKTMDRDRKKGRPVSRDPNPDEPEPGQEFLDALADSMPLRGAPLDAVFQTLMPAIREARSYEDILEEIYARYGSLNTSMLHEMLNQAMFAANVWGWLKSRQEADD